MLATKAPLVGSMADYAFEPKLDGWRCIVEVDGNVTVRTRTGRDVTAALPEFAPLAHLGNAVLDGDLVAGDGRPYQFYRLGPRMWQRYPGVPLPFVAFDVLWLHERSVLHRPYQERRQLLECLALAGAAWQTLPSFVADGPEVFAACEELGLEGLVRSG